MKKSFKLLLSAVMAVATVMPAFALNNQLTLFEGDEFGYAPIDNSYLDEVGTRGQVIYPAASLAEMSGESINSIKFYTEEPITVSGGMIDILIGETARTGFWGNDYVEGLTKVATISMTSGVTEVEITFDSPYLYRGENLVIEAIVTEATECCFIPYIGERPTDYTAIIRGEVAKFLPKTTFNYGEDEEYAAKVTPTELTFNTIRAGQEDVQSVTLKNIGLNGFTPSISATAPFIVEQPNAVLMSGESLEIPVTFAPQTDGTYNGVLTIDCGEAGVLEVALNAVALETAQELIIGDHTDYASFVPLYGLDIDIVGTQGQMIYPASMLSDMVGGRIIGLKFFTKDKVQMDGGVIQLSLKIVDQTVFTVAESATELTAVATVTPTYNGTDLEFTFDEPYQYNGGNLLVECMVIEAGTTNYRQTFFYGNPSLNNQYVALFTTYDEYYGWDTAFVPFLPMAGFTYQKDVLRGDVNSDSIVSIADVTALIDYLLSQDASGINLEAADCNLDVSISIADVTSLIDYLLSQSW